MLVFGASVSTTQAGGISDQQADNLRAALLVSGIVAAGVKRDSQGLVQYSKSLIATAAATLVLKEVVDAERPNGEDNDSFPSGHVSMSAASAAFLHKRYGWRYGLPAYLATLLVAQNRLDNDHHRAVDVLASLAIAVSINEKLTSTLLVTPKLSKSAIGIELRLAY
ncbi:MAG: phosphatase PAP2 family protein [Pseudomonadota bacterium]